MMASVSKPGRFLLTRGECRKASESEIGVCHEIRILDHKASFRNGVRSR